MELRQINRYYYVTIQEQGHDRNGNPLFIVNVFNSDFMNVNFKVNKYHKDKYGNIKLTSYNIDDTIKDIIQSIKSIEDTEEYEDIQHQLND